MDILRVLYVRKVRSNIMPRSNIFNKNMTVWLDDTQERDG